MGTPMDVAQRRARVRHLAAQEMSHRAIAAKLGISKDTVRRDLEAPEPPLWQRLAQRAAQTDEAVRQACAAAQTAIELQPAYVLTDAETARRWYEQLRATAAQLAAHADQFADSYAFARCATDGAPGAAT